MQDASSPALQLAHYRLCLCLQDAIAVWAALCGKEQPPVVLVGHSMGGAVAVRAAATKVSMIHPPCYCPCSALCCHHAACSASASPAHWANQQAKHDQTKRSEFA